MYRIPAFIDVYVRVTICRYCNPVYVRVTILVQGVAWFTLCCLLSSDEPIPYGLAYN